MSTAEPTTLLSNDKAAQSSSTTVNDADRRETSMTESYTSVVTNDSTESVPSNTKDKSNNDDSKGTATASSDTASSANKSSTAMTQATTDDDGSTRTKSTNNNDQSLVTNHVQNGKTHDSTKKGKNNNKINHIQHSNGKSGIIIGSTFNPNNTNLQSQQLQIPSSNSMPSLTQPPSLPSSFISQMMNQNADKNTSTTELLPPPPRLLQNIQNLQSLTPAQDVNDALRELVMFEVEIEKQYQKCQKMQEELNVEKQKYFADLEKGMKMRTQLALDMSNIPNSSSADMTRTDSFPPSSALDALALACEAHTKDGQPSPKKQKLNDPNLKVPYRVSKTKSAKSPKAAKAVKASGQKPKMKKGPLTAGRIKSNRNLQLPTHELEKALFQHYPGGDTGDQTGPTGPAAIAGPDSPSNPTFSLLHEDVELFIDTNEDFAGKYFSNPEKWSNTVTVNDVLCGRGGLTNNHPGNVFFRSLVRSRQEKYLFASKRDKALVAHSIVEAVRTMEPPGRFLKKNSNDKWMEIGNKKAREKTSQALREKAPELMELLQKDYENSDSFKVLREMNKRNAVYGHGNKICLPPLSLPKITQDASPKASEEV